MEDVQKLSDMTPVERYTYNNLAGEYTPPFTEKLADEYSGLRAPPIRNGIPTKRRMIPTSFLHAIRRNVLSVRK